MCRDEKSTAAPADERGPYFPLFVNLTGRRVLVAGAGTVGCRRACLLAEFGAQVTVFDPFTDGQLLKEEDKTGTVGFRKCSVREEDLEGIDLAVAATSDDGGNAWLVEKCRGRGIPVNHAGDRTRCDFFFPAVAEADGLVIGVCSSGKDHRKVRHFTARLRAWLAKSSGDIGG